MSDKYGYILQIIAIGNGYANFKDDEENLCQIDDKYNQPEPIPLTPEILEKNGFSSETFLTAEWDYKTKVGVAEALSKTKWPTVVMSGNSGQNTAMDVIALKQMTDLVDKMSK